MTATCHTQSVPSRHQSRYILQRVLDCMVREDYRLLATKGTIIPADEASFGTLAGQTSHYLLFRTCDDAVLHVPVEPDGFMQDWRVSDLPILQTGKGAMRVVDSATELLEVMGTGLDNEDKKNLNSYLAECHAAIEQGMLCAVARSQSSPAEVRLADHPHWHRAMISNDRLASFRDHPFYPTARAKLGFSAHDLIAYGPEYQNIFQLAWLAVPSSGLIIQGDGHAIWPSFADVGLDPDMATTHELLPYHPFMRGEKLAGLLVEAGLTEHVHLAPTDYLDVIPTLSVRVVAFCDAPGLHLKLPLAISTLGLLNLRSIKPSTINDGHSVQSLLSEIIAADPAFESKLLLTDESRGAHYSNNRFLGYILRQYPEGLDDVEPVPVAALMSQMPDGRPYALHLVDRYYHGDTEAFLNAFSDLLLGIHLRLVTRYGIALEANQQNSTLLFGGDDGLRLMLKDNDAPRLDYERLHGSFPQGRPWLDRLQDDRLNADVHGIIQMLITITIQLNLGCIVEGLGRHDGGLLSYRRNLRQTIERHLDRLANENIETGSLRTELLEKSHFPIKYLMRAASLEIRQGSIAADVNKFYGINAPNFLYS